MSKLTSLLKSRVQTVAHGSKEKQKGATALEYLVLAAVIIVGLFIAAGVFFSDDGDNGVGAVFSEIGKKLTDKVGTAE